MTAKVKSQRRFAKHAAPGKPMVLGEQHKAVVGAVTLFPTQVREPDNSSILFKPGANNSKIGSHVTKGDWAGMPIYLLSLEERATCPTVCGSWRSCYGNHMPFARRWKAGAELEYQIPVQLAKLAKKHPSGFVVRLHVLGDFYSTHYTKIWRELMILFPALHVYGYTRRGKNHNIGKLLENIAVRFPLRWRVRWSERGGEMGTTTIDDVTARGRIAEGIVCPAQTEGDEVSCGSCALCWGSKEPIVFISH
jgi:hypothetical protein